MGIKSRMEVGLSRDIAASMYTKADDDCDGEVTRLELGWLANDELATIGQVQGVFQEGIGAPEDGKLYADSQMKEIAATFRSWDKDGDGTITCDEIARVLQTLNPSLGEKSTNL